MAPRLHPFLRAEQSGDTEVPAMGVWLVSMYQNPQASEGQ